VLLGLLVGTPLRAFLVIFFASLLGTLVSIPLIARGKQGLQLRIPFGPYLLLATVLVVLYGTPMGSANSHSNSNLPVMIAGGGFKHGQHLAFDTTNNYPLANLYVSMLQRLGIEADTFSTSKGTMRGLELA